MTSGYKKNNVNDIYFRLAFSFEKICAFSECVRVERERDREVVEKTSEASHEAIRIKEKMERKYESWNWEVIRGKGSISRMCVCLSFFSESC